MNFDTARKVLIQNLKDACKQARNSRYYVKRGPIVWPSFNFEVRPYAISIGMDEFSMMRDINEGGIRMEFAASMDSEAEEVDEDLMEEFIDDAHWIIRTVIDARNSQGDSVVLRLNLEEVSGFEFFDVRLGIQGVIVQFGTSY